MKQNGNRGGHSLDGLPPYMQNAQPLPPGATGGAPGYSVDAQRVIYHLTQINARQVHEIALLTAALEATQKPKGETNNG